MCPDGLRFNPAAKWNEYPCAYPIDVPCKERSVEHPAQPTDSCPRQYGYFGTGDSKNCGRFRNCMAGVGFDFYCPEGLAYNPITYDCDWPDQVKECDAESYVGLRCPAPPQDIVGKIYDGPVLYPFEGDCTKYYACLSGKPRLLSCEHGLAFDEESSRCEDIDNVASCKNWRPKYMRTIVKQTKETREKLLKKKNSNLRLP